jgi:hypothetical protein
VSAESVETIFAGSGFGGNWPAFRSKFNATGWLAFSGILLTDDGLNARSTTRRGVV